MANRAPRLIDANGNVYKWQTIISYPNDLDAAGERRCWCVSVPDLLDSREACEADVRRVAAWPELPDGTTVSACNTDGYVSLSITVERASISVADAAEQLGIAPRTVRQHADKLNLGERRGRDLFFTPAEVAMMRARVGQVGRPPKPPTT